MDDVPARLFVALWPDHALAAAIAAQSARWQWPKHAQRIGAERLHVTLHFIGDVERDRVAPLRQALRALPVEPIELVLDTHALWRNGVASLRPSATPPALLRLHEAVGAALCEAGVETERREWRAHLTLARRAAGAVPPQESFALHWRADGPVLVESERQAPRRYLILERYPRTSATGSAPKSARSR